MTSNTPNTPGDFWLSREYSPKKDLTVNATMLIAVLIAAGTDILFRQRFSQVSLPVRSILAALPFALLLFWIGSLRRWIGGMDEMHRRIAISSSCFAVVCTLWFLMLWHRLDKAGLFQSLFAPGKPNANFDILTISHAFLLLVLFYAIGYSRYNREYR